jgi:hypothetical protein
MPQLPLEFQLYPIPSTSFRSVHGLVGTVDDIFAFFIIRPEIGNAN